MDNQKNQSKNKKKSKTNHSDSDISSKNKKTIEWIDWAYSPIESPVDNKKEQRINKPGNFPNKKKINGTRHIKNE